MFNAKLLNSFKFLRQAQSGAKEQKTQKDTLEAYPSLMKLAIMGLSGLLLLTGCASSPSLEGQMKLVEYQACLEKQESISEAFLDFIAKNENFENPLTTILKMGEPDPKTGLISNLERAIKNCEKYRP